MSEMNSAPPKTNEQASIRERPSQNGTLSPSSDPASRPNASMRSPQQESASNKEYDGDLASVQNSTEPKTTPRRPRFIRNKRIGEDGCFTPNRAPSQHTDGTYARPRGPPPRGFFWDATRGVYAPVANGTETNDSLNDTDVTATTGASSGQENYSSLDTGVESSGASGNRKQRSTPPVPSSMGSFASSQSDKDENGGKHNTRSKRGRFSKDSSKKKRRNGNGSDTTDRPPVDKSAAARSVNECASLLAQADDESYQRAILQDATSILERLLFPMCFPWNHDIIPALRNFPKDIDELPAVLQADKDEYSPFQNGFYGYGGFEVGKERRSPHDAAVLAHGDTYLAATRRTDDVGVIELTVVDNERVLDESSRLRKRKRQEEVGGEPADSDTIGEAARTSPLSHDASARRYPSPEPPRKPPAKRSSYDNGDVVMRAENKNGTSYAESDYIRQGYEHAKNVKEQKAKAAEENTHRLLVSVRFGSVSSRSSVLTTTSGDNSQDSPLLCQAVIPTRKNRSNIANYQYGESQVDRAKWLRRDILSWMHSNTSAGGYVSKLSHTTTPSVMAKKPREVRVGVRLNGKLLSYRPTPDDTRTPGTIIDGVLGFQDDGPYFASLSQGRQVNTAMCMLDRTKLMEVKVPRGTIGNSAPRKAPLLSCIPPFVCGGSTQVVCSAPGTLQRTNISELFRQEHGKKCSVCWTNEGEVKQCNKCGVQVHPSCCAHGGVLVPSNNASTDDMSWMCAVCSEGPKTSAAAASSPSPRKRAKTLPARYQSDSMVLGMGLSSPRRDSASSSSVDGALKCSLCPHSGGAMSPVGTSGDWCHEVCRIWSQSQVRQEDNEKETIIMPTSMSRCALCGLQDKSVIKCAGSGCTVRFHPMCAMISDMDSSPQQQYASSDHRLCHMFTVDLLQCGDSLLPVGFCGFHNPSRDRFLYGCYPSGMASSMRVPTGNMPS